MPHQMAYGINKPGLNNDENKLPAKLTRNPIEITSLYYLECRYVYKELGMTYERWLKETSEEEKMNFRSFIRIDAAKESYSNMSKEDRDKFLT